jgi:hypothetical protein
MIPGEYPLGITRKKLKKNSAIAFLRGVKSLGVGVFLKEAPNLDS